MAKEWRSPGLDLFEQMGQMQDLGVSPAQKMMRELSKGLVDDRAFKNPLAQALGNITDSLRPKNLMEWDSKSKLALDVARPLGRATSLDALLGPKSSLDQITNRSLLGTGAAAKAMMGQSGLSALSGIEAATKRSLASSLGVVGFRDLDRSISKMFPETRGSWADHVRRVKPIDPFLDLNRRVACLTPVPGSPHLSMSWFDRHATRFSFAGLLPAREEAGTQIVIEVEVRCVHCQATMVLVGSQLEWRGARRGIVKADVVPICEVCFDRERREPGHIERMYDALLAGPAHPLRVLKGEGCGDGVRKGSLRLVDPIQDGEGDLE